MHILIPKEQRYDFLCWVVEHNREMLSNTWVYELGKKSPSKVDKVHSTRTCPRIERTSSLQDAFVEDNEPLGCYSNIDVNCDCIAKGFSSDQTLDQAYTLYEIYSQFENAVEPKLGATVSEARIFVPLQVQYVLNKYNVRRRTTSEVEKLVCVVEQEQSRLQKEFATPELQDKTHTWARRLAVSSSVANKAKPSAKIGGSFARFFANNWAWNMAVENDPDRTLELIISKGLSETLDTEELRSWVENYYRLLNRSKPELCLMIARNTARIQMGILRNPVWQYLGANRLFFDDKKSFALYKIDKDMAKWLVYASKNSLHRANNPSADATLVSPDNLDREVLHTAVKLWEPDSNGPYKHFRAAFKAALKV